MTPKHFEKLEFNPVALKDGELMQEAYSYFGKRDVFSVPLSEQEGWEGDLTFGEDTAEVLSSLLKFVVLFIDRNSPYYDDDDFEQRKLQCYKWAKIKKGDRAEWHIEGDSEWYQYIMTAYFRYINNVDYEDWVSRKISTASMHRYLRAPIGDDPEKASKAHIEITKNIDMMKKELIKVEATVFPKNKKVAEKLKQALERKETLTGYAEKMAKQVPI